MIGDREPTPQLTTTRIGGRSARLVAVGLAVVLVAVVYVGISQRDSAPTATHAPVAAVVATAPASEQPVAIEPPASPSPPTVTVINERGSLVGRYGDLRVVLKVGEQSAVAALEEVDTRQLHAAYRIRLPATKPFATLELIEGATEPSTATYGSWAVPLTLNGGGENVDVDISAFVPTTLFEQEQPPDPTATDDAPVLVRNGYRIRVGGAKFGETATINVDVQLGRERSFPDEGYNVVAKAGKHTFRTNQSTLEIVPGHMHGAIFMPLSLGVRYISVELTALPSGADAPVILAFDTFRAPTRDEHELTQDSTYSRGGEASPGTPQILSNGYSYSLLFTFAGDSRALFWDLKVNPTFELDP